MKKIYPVLLSVFISLSIILLAVILQSFNVYKNPENPETCSLCHEMKSYVISYLTPEKGSVIADHKLNCIDCHSGKSRKAAKDAALTEIKIGALAKITGTRLDTDRSALAVNCTQCHGQDFRHFNIAVNTSCLNCHWAHKSPQAKTESIFLVPYGPHRNQSCRNCHGTNFQIPRCTDCHKGHGEKKFENALCLACHADPHTPKKPGILPGNTVKFNGSLPFEACSPCHENEYFEVTNSLSRHTRMETCTLCHRSHGEKPRCRDCHPGMAMEKHKDFGCGSCHIDFKNKIICQDCHGTTYHDLTASTAVLNRK